MAKNLSVTHQKTYISKGIIPGAIIGGFGGILIGFLAFNEIVGGTLLGIIIGGLIGGFLALYSTENINAEYVPETSTPKQDIYCSKNVTLQIKELWSQARPETSSIGQTVCRNSTARNFC